MNKPLPNNRQIEVALIASVFLKPDIMLEVAEILKPEDFYYKPHEIIYSKLDELYQSNTPIDLDIFVNSVGKASLTAIGGITYLMDIIGSEVTSVNYKEYVKIIKDLSHKRRLINSCQLALQSAYSDESDVKDIVESLGSDFMDLNNFESKDKTVNASELMDSTIYMISEGMKNGGKIIGVPTGYRGIDNMTNGLMKGDLMIIAARPSMGKTAFTLNVLNRIPANHKAALFELEMSKEKLGIRLLAPKAMMNSRDLGRGNVKDDQFGLMLEKANGISVKDNLFINCKSSLTTTEIRAEAKLIKKQHGLDVIFIDHIGLIKPNNLRASRNDQVGQISKDLKDIAKDLECCVVALSQLSRGVESRPDKRPMLSDLRDSGNIEQDADVVLMLYRDDYYAERECRESEKPGVLEIMSAKNRDGEVGLVELNYNTQYQLISEIDYVYEGQYRQDVFKGGSNGKTTNSNKKNGS